LAHGARLVVDASKNLAPPRAGDVRAADPKERLRANSKLPSALRGLATMVVAGLIAALIAAASVAVISPRWATLYGCFNVL
jgi:hypothetical protein